MKRTNTKEFNALTDRYILDSVYDFEGGDKERAAHIRELFESEYNYPDNKRRIPNDQARVGEWLSGLPLDIAYTYHDIIAISEQWHECTLTEKQRETVCQNWFHFMAFRLIQCLRRNGVDI